MRIKFCEDCIVEVEEVNVAYRSAVEDSFDEKDYDNYGLSADIGNWNYMWLYSLEEYSLEEAKQKVAFHMDKLLKEGWTDMTGIPYITHCYDTDVKRIICRDDDEDAE